MKTSLMNGFNLDLSQSNCWQLTGKCPCLPRRHKQRVFIQLGSSIPVKSCQILIYPLIFPGIAVESILFDLSLPPWRLCLLAGQWGACGNSILEDSAAPRALWMLHVRQEIGFFFDFHPFQPTHPAPNRSGKYFIRTSQRRSPENSQKNKKNTLENLFWASPKPVCKTR